MTSQELQDEDEESWKFSQAVNGQLKMDKNSTDVMMPTSN